MNSKCRSCQIMRDQHEYNINHNMIDVGLHCPLCNYSGKSIFHPESRSHSGISLECYNCNNYILYASVGGLIWKDEIYLEKDYCLMRDLESLQSYIIVDDECVCKLNYILQFSDSKYLFNKLKTMIVFS